MRFALGSLPAIASHIAALCIGSAIARLTAKSDAASQVPLNTKRSGIYLVMPQNKFHQQFKLTTPTKIKLASNDTKPCQIHDQEMWVIPQKKMLTLYISGFTLEHSNTVSNILNHQTPLSIYPAEERLQRCAHVPVINYLDR